MNTNDNAVDHVDMDKIERLRQWNGTPCTVELRFGPGAWCFAEQLVGATGPARITVGNGATMEDAIDDLLAMVAYKDHHGILASGGISITKLADFAQEMDARLAKELG